MRTSSKYLLLMKKALFLFLFIPVLLKAQQDIPNDKPVNNLFIGIQAGLNISKYISDSLIEPNRAALPLIGANVSIPFNKTLNLRIGGIYSLRGTNYIDPVYCKIRYNYLDIPTIIQIKTGNFFRFEVGAISSLVFSSKALFHAAGDSVVGLPKKGSGLEIALHLGAEFTLQKGIDIGFSYEIPTKSTAFDNFRFTITYSFQQAAFNKSSNVKSDIAIQQIQELRNNVILVRLKTSENQINALQKMGRTEDAEKLKQKQFARNREIMNAFKKNFNFCPVYFFFSSSSYYIKHNQYNGRLLNDSLLADTSIKFNFNKPYIAEFDFIEPDTIYGGRSLYDQKSYQSDSIFTLSNTHLTEALVIRNPYFTQLKQPFPYYVKMEEWLKRKSYAMAVGILNEQLHNFLKQSILLENQK